MPSTEADDRSACTAWPITTIHWSLAGSSPLQAKTQALVNWPEVTAWVDHEPVWRRFQEATRDVTTAGMDCERCQVHPEAPVRLQTA